MHGVHKVSYLFQNSNLSKFLNEFLIPTFQFWVSGVEGRVGKLLVQIVCDVQGLQHHLIARVQGRHLPIRVNFEVPRGLFLQVDIDDIVRNILCVQYNANPLGEGAEPHSIQA